MRFFAGLRYAIYLLSAGISAGLGVAIVAENNIVGFLVGLALVSTISAIVSAIPGSEEKMG